MGNFSASLNVEIVTLSFISSSLLYYLSLLDFRKIKFEKSNQVWKIKFEKSSLKIKFEKSLLKNQFWKIKFEKSSLTNCSFSGWGQFFDCLAHPNKSATFFTDQKWSLSHLRMYNLPKFSRVQLTKILIRGRP